MVHACSSRKENWFYNFIGKTRSPPMAAIPCEMDLRWFMASNNTK